MSTLLDSEAQMEDALWRYISPFIILIGIVGNVLSFLVMSSKKLHGSITSLYLRVLAVVDCLVLTTGLLRQWIRVLAVDIRDTSAFVCKTDVFLLYWSLGSSAWILSLIAIERCFGVIYPHHYTRSVTKRSATILVAAVLMILSLTYTPILAIVDLVIQPQANATNITELTQILPGNNSELKHCRPHEPTFYYIAITHMIVAVLLPFLIIISSNAIIITRLTLSKFKSASSQVKAKSSNMTFILILVSVYFLIMTSPANIFEILYHQWKQNIEKSSVEMHSRMPTVWAVVNLLMYMNSAGNFFLYCLSGPVFRNQLKEMFCTKINPEFEFTEVNFTTARLDSNKSCF